MICMFKIIKNGLLILFTLLQLTDQQTYVGLLFNNAPVPMYSQGTYKGGFTYLNDPLICSYNYLYTILQTSTQKSQNSPYLLQINVTSNIQINISTVYSHFLPTLNQTSCSSNCEISITNNCPSTLTNRNYFDVINLDITSFTRLSYNVICDTSFENNTFDYGKLIIIVVATIILLIGAMKSKFYSMAGKGIQVGFIVIVCYNVVLILGGVLSIYARNGSSILADILSWIFGVLCLTMFSIQCIYLVFRTQLIRKSIQIKTISIRIVDIMGSIIGLALTFGWWFSGKNWVISDIIAISIIFASIKVFKFVSLKMALICFATSMLVEIGVLIGVQVATSQQYDAYLISQFNTPFLFQLPTIVPVFNQKCSWLAVTVIVYPGILMAYLRRFDNSRGINLYMIVSIATFFSGSIIWLIISTFSKYELPFGLISQPVMIGSFVLFAFKRKELRTLWEGKFFDIEFVNKESIKEMREDILKEVEMTDKEIFKEELFKGLQIDTMEQSQNQPQQNGNNATNSI